MTYIMRNNCLCPICAGVIKMDEGMFFCFDCRAEFEIEKEGLADGEYVCVQTKKGREGAA